MKTKRYKIAPGKIYIPVSGTLQDEFQQHILSNSRKCPPHASFSRGIRQGTIIDGVVSLQISGNGQNT